MTIQHLMATFKRLTRFSSDRNGTILRLFGLWLAYKPFGNCFAPALILKPYKLGNKQACSFTVRTTSHKETTFYWYGGFRFFYNSEHLATRFGTFTDNDFGGCWQLKSKLLGNHIRL